MPAPLPSLLRVLGWHARSRSQRGGRVAALPASRVHSPPRRARFVPAAFLDINIIYVVSQRVHLEAILKDQNLYLQAGGGVVFDSDAETEFQETINKSKALLKAAQDSIHFFGD